MGVASGRARYAFGTRVDPGVVAAMTNKTRLGLRLTGVAVAVGAGMATPTAAQGQGLTIEVSQCADLAAPDERLACYDKQVESARRGRGPATPGPTATAAVPDASGARSPSAPVPAATAPAVPASAAGPAPAVVAPTAAAAPSDSVPPDIFAKVAELRETVPNTWLITLDNGQVWRQTTPEHYPLRVGLDVRIYFAQRWRSYRLTNEQLRRYIQVERVR
jgi:hypothetical protein